MNLKAVKPTQSIVAAMLLSWMATAACIRCVAATEVEPTAVETAADEPVVDFGRDVAPLFAKNCVACHNAKKAEGGLNLESYEMLMQGGDSGAAVEAGNIDTGELLARIVDDDAPMPPEDNSVGAKRLSEAEVAAIRQWIAAGAPAPSLVLPAGLQWQSLPESVHPIYALATSADGNYLALGRGNQAFVLRQSALAAPEQAYPLVDPAVGQLLSQTSPADTPVEAAHLDIVQSIAFSPDSQRLATGGYRAVKIWKRQIEPIESLASGFAIDLDSAVIGISADGYRVAVARQNQLELIDLPMARSHRLLKAHAQPISAVAWLDASTVLTGDSGGQFAVTDVESLVFQPLAGESLPPARQLLTLGSGRLLAIGAAGELVELIIDRQLQQLSARRVAGFDSEVTALTASQTAEWVVVGLEDGSCRLIDSQRLEAIRQWSADAPVRRLAVSPDGQWLVTSTGFSAAQLWKVEDGMEVARLDRDYRYGQLFAAAQRSAARQQGLLERLAGQLTELTKASEAEEAARAKVQETRDKAAEELSNQQAEMAKAAEEVAQAQTAMAEAEQAVAEAMKLVETRKSELEAKQKAMADAESKQGKATEELAKREQALVAATDVTVRAAARVPEMEQRIASERQQLEQLEQQATQLADEPQAKHQARLLAFAADSQRVAVADEAGRIHLFSASDGSPEVNWLTDSPLAALSTTNDGRLVGLTANGVAQHWDLRLPWKLERTLGSFEDSPFSDRITALDFSPDGNRLAVGSGPPSRFGDIKIIDLTTDHIVDLGEAHSDSVLALRFSPDGRRLASGGADKLCRVFDAESGQPLGALEGHTHHVLAVGWKDDGVTLATGSADQSVKLWNVEAFTQNRSVGGFKKEVTALAFVGQTDQFVAVDASGTAQLIEAGGGKQVRAFSGADGPLLALGISPDGQLLFAGGQSGNHWVWKIEDGQKLR